MAPKKVSPASAAPAADSTTTVVEVKKVVKKAAAPVAEPVAAAPAPEVVADATESSEGEDNSLLEIALKVSTMQALLKDITALVKVHQKTYIKLVRQAKKIERKKAQAKKSPSGFAKPSLLANELCDFLGVEHGTMMARTQVTKHITDYVKSKGLLDPENKRIMNLDAALKKLMVVPDGAQVTFFNLQKFIKHLFIKETSA